MPTQTNPPPGDTIQTRGATGGEESRSGFGLSGRSPQPKSQDSKNSMTSEQEDRRQDEADGPALDTRRELIRKAVYSAPVLIALGSLMESRNAAAQDGSEPPCQPGFDC